MVHSEHKPDLLFYASPQMVSVIRELCNCYNYDFLKVSEESFNWFLTMKGIVINKRDELPFIRDDEKEIHYYFNVEGVFLIEGIKVLFYGVESHFEDEILNMFFPGIPRLYEWEELRNEIEKRRT